jgi:hypothetical protein
MLTSGSAVRQRNGVPRTAKVTHNPGPGMDGDGARSRGSEAEAGPPLVATLDQWQEPAALNPQDADGPDAGAGRDQRPLVDIPEPGSPPR